MLLHTQGNTKMNHECPVCYEILSSEKCCNEQLTDIEIEDMFEFANQIETVYLWLKDIEESILENKSLKHYTDEITTIRNLISTTNELYKTLNNIARAHEERTELIGESHV